MSQLSMKFLSIVPGLLLVPLTGGALLAQVSGTVLESGSGDPLEDALVTLQATGTRVVSDADGYFEFPDLSGSALVLVAAKKGFFHGSITVDAPLTGVEISMDAVPQDDDADYTFLNPVLCGFCHATQKEEWDASRMSGTGLNQWVYDLYNGTGTSGGDEGFVYTRDSVHANSHPNSECAACHQPVRWISNDRDIALGPISTPNAAMRAGVSCDICHLNVALQ